jgi:hypothetical protein
MSWDWIITMFILIVLTLTIWARISKQTIPELFGEIRDFILDTKDNVREEAEDTFSYYR